MSKDRKKELKEQYKQMKPEMGVLLVRSKTNHKCFIEGTQNLRVRINSTKFKLNAGGHPNQELQKDWTKDGGESNFTIEILDYLEYDKDGVKTDYSEELAMLETIWKEKLANENVEFYNK